MALRIAVMAMLVWSRLTGAAELAPCPPSPNCVSSTPRDAPRAVAPIPLDVPADVAAARLRRALATLPRTTIIADDGSHLHAECRSAAFGFVDDVDVLVDEVDHVIHVRSASRVGYWDLGANGRRVERLRAAYAASATGQ